ncbi:MAG: hypothetical protein Q7S55_04325 [Nanoarchaeota archaeon]|nr:hypothetical protein [Nanoarchaeota archaeon]
MVGSEDLFTYSANISPDYILNHEEQKLNLTTEYLVGPKIKSKISYFLGKNLDLPLLILCFNNTGTKYSDTNISSFQTVIIINNEVTINIPYNDTVCQDLSPDKEQFLIERSSIYRTSFQDENRINNNGIDISNQLNIETEPKINYENVWILYFATLFAWWGLWVLITRVIVITYNGLELKDKKK